MQSRGRSDPYGRVPPGSPEELREPAFEAGLEGREEADAERAVESELPAYLPGSPVTGRGARIVYEGISRNAPYRCRAEDALTGALESLESSPAVWVRPLLGSLALWVLDLPASQSNHHSYRYGLLDHLLEVALGATLPFAFRPKGPRFQDRRDRRVLRLLAVTGLLHDIGKVFSVTVRAPGSEELWDPLREPLVFFKVRQGMRIFQPTPFRFIRGRGVKSHEEKGTALLPLVLPGELRKETGEDISAAYAAYTGRYDAAPTPRRVPMDYVAIGVHRADIRSARCGHTRKGEPSPLLRELQDRAALEKAGSPRSDGFPEDPVRRTGAESAGERLDR